MEDDVEDLIGPPTVKPSSRRAAETLEALVRRRRHEDDLDGEPSLDVTDVHGGVTVGWISQVFGMDPTTVKKKLADCPPMHRRKAGYVYSLPLAARYLVKPVFDVAKYIANMRPSELPTQLQSEYWDAQNKRLKYEEAAGHLWRTEDVQAVLGEVFQTIKFSIQLFPDNLERAAFLSDDQRKKLVVMTDALQKEIHEKLIENDRLKKTRPVIDELKQETKPVEVEADE